MSSRTTPELLSLMAFGSTARMIGMLKLARSCAIINLTTISGMKWLMLLACGRPLQKFGGNTEIPTRATYKTQIGAPMSVSKVRTKGQIGNLKTYTDALWRCPSSLLTTDASSIRNVTFAPIFALPGAVYLTRIRFVKPASIKRVFAQRLTSTNTAGRKKTSIGVSGPASTLNTAIIQVGTIGVRDMKHATQLGIGG